MAAVQRTLPARILAFQLECVWKGRAALWGWAARGRGSQIGVRTACVGIPGALV